MARTYTSNSKKVFARRSNAVRQQIDYLDPNAKRQAKRLGRQQKRLVKETGLDCNIIDINENVGRQKIVRLEDIKDIKPLTDTQADFFDSWADNDADGYVLFGSAGTGKTMIALYNAILDVMDPNITSIHKLVIVRSSVQSRDQGHLPGDTAEKMMAFEAPYHSVFSSLTGKKEAYEKLKDMGKVEFVSTSFLRGDTFSNSIIIVDEFQSMSWHELKTICTRLGKDSKIIFCGDNVQNDLIKSKNDVSGFPEFMEVSRKMPSFRHFRFTEDDIVRSGFVKDFIVACNKAGL